MSTLAHKLGLYRHRIGIGLADWPWIKKGLALVWHLIGKVMSESSSVETLRSVPVVNLFPAHLRVGNRIGMGLASDW